MSEQDDIYPLVQLICDHAAQNNLALPPGVEVIYGGAGYILTKEEAKAKRMGEALKDVLESDLEHVSYRERKQDE